MKLSKLIFSCSILFLALPLFWVSASGQTSETAAAAAIQEAEAGLTSAYAAMREAESFGANVSGLQERMNYAGSLLADAVMRFESKDFNGAVDSASLANESIHSLQHDAVILADLASAERGQLFSWTVAASTFGISLVVFAGFAGWKRVEKAFGRKFLKMKPEVCSNDELE